MTEERMDTMTTMAERVPAEVLEVGRVLRSAGHQAFLVGGAVRDLMLGRVPHDHDVATDALPAEVSGLFSRVLQTGVAHGTVTVVLGEVSVEVTTFRGEGAYTDGRRPDSVRFLRTVEEDLSRRDFTVNAMAVCLVSGEVRDPFGGGRDLAAGLVRAVGSPAERFGEDGLRVMRAVRLSAQLGFRVDAETLAAVPGALGSFRKVSAERVRDELMKLLAAPDAAEAVTLMDSAGLLREALPELADCRGVGQNRYHRWDVLGHSVSALRALNGSDASPLLRLVSLLHDVGKPSTRTVGEAGEVNFLEHDEVGADMVRDRLRALKFSNAETERAERLVRHHLVMYQPEWTDRTVRRFLRRVGTDLVDDLLRLYTADEWAKPKVPVSGPALRLRVDAVAAESPALEVRALAVSGADVMEVRGCPPGPEVGRVLRALLEAVTDRPALNVRESLRALAREV